MSKELVQKQFGAHAAAYATSETHAHGASLVRLVELLQPQSTWQVLDIATAAGHTAFALAPHVAQVVAADLTPEMIPVAAKVAAEKGITNVTLETADAEALPYVDASFDLVTCRIAPHHFPHIDRFMAESARVLRAGGLLAVVDNVVPGTEGDTEQNTEQNTEQAREAQAAGEYVNAFEKLRDPSHGRALSVAEWLEAFAAVGLTLLHQEVALKAMEFNSWAERMGATPATIVELRRLLLEAPPAAAAYFMPQVQGDDIGFYLHEAMIIGRKV